MNKKIIGLFGLSVITFISTSNLYASDLSAIGGIRERFETLDGMNKKEYGTTDDTLLVSRLKLGMIYKQSSDITFKAIAYYANVYGWSLERDDFKN